MVGFVLDEDLAVDTRMTAASICLPYLYPKLSASTVDARVTNVSLDASAVMAKLSARLERLTAPIEGEEGGSGSVLGNKTMAGDTP